MNPSFSRKGTTESNFITMKWTREKALFILQDELPPSAKNYMTDEELFNIGVDLKYWQRTEED